MNTILTLDPDLPVPIVALLGVLFIVLFFGAMCYFAERFSK